MAEPRFVDNGSTVTDHLTGLTWEKKHEGTAARWQDAPHAVDTACCWWDAVAAWVEDLNAARFGGHDDWRLPAPHELISIIDYTKAQPPALDPIFGPVAPGFYWTSAPVAFHDALAWKVLFLDGSVFVDDKGNHAGFRAVRTGR